MTKKMIKGILGWFFQHGTRQTESEFDAFYAKWVKYALPSPEDIYFVKAVKELVK